jgi:hypothetical protein
MTGHPIDEPSPPGSRSRDDEIADVVNIRLGADPVITAADVALARAKPAAERDDLDVMIMKAEEDLES